MTLEEIEKQINRISWGNRYIKVTEQNEREHLILVKSLSLRFRNWIDFIHDTAYQKAKELGILTEKEMLTELSNNKTWTAADDELITSMSKTVEEMSSTVSSLTKHEQKRANRIIDSYRSKIEEMSNKKRNLLDCTCEKYAGEQRLRAFVFASCFKVDTEEKYWPTWDIFLEEASDEVVMLITSQIMNTHRCDTKEIREIARSGNWRHRWNSASSIIDVFGRPIVELDEEQGNLVYWSTIYDSVFESMERPPQEIIDNDELLDKWFEEQGRKNALEDKKRYLDKKNSRIIPSSVNRHGEIFIAPSTSVSAKEIEDMNSPVNKAFIDRQHNKLKKNVIMTEQEMRADQEARRLIGAQDNVVDIKRRSDGLVGKHIKQTLPGGTLTGRRN